jgi:hypothetical protein
MRQAKHNRVNRCCRIHHVWWQYQTKRAEWLAGGYRSSTSSLPDLPGLHVPRNTDAASRYTTFLMGVAGYIRCGGSTATAAAPAHCQTRQACRCRTQKAASRHTLVINRCRVQGQQNLSKKGQMVQPYKGYGRAAAIAGRCRVVLRYDPQAQHSTAAAVGHGIITKVYAFHANNHDTIATAHL